MKVVRSDRFLIIYVENRELSVYLVCKSTEEYKIFLYESCCAVKVVRSDRLLT